MLHGKTSRCGARPSPALAHRFERGAVEVIGWTCDEIRDTDRAHHATVPGWRGTAPTGIAPRFRARGLALLAACPAGGSGRYRPGYLAPGGAEGLWQHRRGFHDHGSPGGLPAPLRQLRSRSGPEEKAASDR